MRSSFSVKQVAYPPRAMVLIAGIEFESDESDLSKDLKIFEHRQVWLCKPLAENHQ